MPHSELSYWLVNVPRSEWPTPPSACPDFLLDISEKDKRTLSTHDTAFEPLTWLKVKKLIRTNRVDLFQRRPSALRLYRKFCYKIAQRYGSMMKYILCERLQWSSPSSPNAKSLDDPAAYKILPNDWPYGLVPEVKHLVIWTKFALPDDPKTGYLTPETQEMCEAWVCKTFVEKGGMERDDVVWFKNPKKLKSVHAVEHFHVMLRDPPVELVERLTGGGKPVGESWVDEDEHEDMYY